MVLVDNKYELDFSSQNKIQYFVNLRNKIWKLLPIYEGRDKDKKIVYSVDQAYNNFYQSLTRIVTEVLGLKNIYNENPQYAELLYILEGMKTFSEAEHDRVKDVVLYCCNLCEKMKEECTNGVEVL